MFKPKYNEKTYIDACIRIHGEKYSYDKTEYKSIKDKVVITCLEHGEFEQTAEVHLRGNGCKECGIKKRADKKRTPLNKFLDECREKHGDKYDYKLVKFNDINEKIEITCPIHGKFLQTASAHKNGAGCKRCNDDEVTRNYIDRFNKIHGYCYDYSLNEKIISGICIKIICPIHGIFEQDVLNHLSSQGCGCQKCREDDRLIIENEKVIERINTENFITGLFYNDKSESYIFNCIKHGKYKKTPMKIRQNNLECPQCSRYTKKTKEYYQKLINERKLGDHELTIISDEEFLTVANEYIITCGLHGEFKRVLQSFIASPNCNQCPSNRSYTTEEFIKISREMHGDIYDYSKVEYVNNNTEIIIICPEHGEFKCQPRNHTSSGRGCPKCAKHRMSNGEKRVQVILEKYKIKYETQKTFDGCKNVVKLRFDFYLPEHNLLIEYNGEQHYKPVRFLGKKELSEKNFEYIKNNDNIKKEFCLNNDIRLITIPYSKFRNCEKIILSELNMATITSEI